MDYNSNDQLLKYFEEEISNASKKKLAELRKEIDDLKASQLKMVDEELKSSNRHALNIELKEVNSDHSIEISKIKSENAKTLMNRRLELLNDIFIEVREKLLEFSKTKKYTDLMITKIISYKTKFMNKPVVFNVKLKDENLIKAIKENFTGKHEINKTDKIELGGFSIDCYEMGIEIDETMDYKLNEKKQGFYKESNLYIK